MMTVILVLAILAGMSLPTAAAVMGAGTMAPSGYATDIYQARSETQLTNLEGDGITLVNSVLGSGAAALTSTLYTLRSTLGEPGLPTSTTTLTSASFHHQPGFLAASNSTIVSPCYTLTKTVSPTAGGSISVNPSPNCNNGTQYTAGAVVTLTATPNSGYTFSNWSGDANGPANQVVVTMNTNKNVTANFAPPTNAVILTISDGSGTPGSTGNRVTLSADNQTANTTSIASAQFVVIYNSTTGITLTSASPTSRASGFNTSPPQQDRTNPAAVKATILLYNLNGQTIASGTGPILDLLFDVNSSATPGVTSTLMFSSALLSDAAGNPILADYRDTGQFTILSPCACGDVNCDGAVNIFDLQILINMILHTPQPDSTLYPLPEWTRADLTGDGQWNIFDLQRLINCILNHVCVCGTPSALARSASSVLQPAGTNVISLPNVTAQPGLSSGSFDIGLNNQDIVASSQIQFIYSSAVGLNVTGVRVASRTTGVNTSFGLDTSNPAQTKVTVLLYNMSGLTLAPGSGPIVTVDYTLAPTARGGTPLSLTQALLSDSLGLPLPVTPVNGSCCKVQSLYRVWLPVVVR